MVERETTSMQILKDVFDGIEHFYGKEGLDQVTHYAVLRNRSRESNKLMDQLEVAFGPFDIPDLVGPLVADEYADSKLNDDWGA